MITVLNLQFFDGCDNCFSFSSISSSLPGNCTQPQFNESGSRMESPVGETISRETYWL